MNSNSSFLKRLARVLIVFLAGVILIINTACSQTPSASTYSSGETSTDNTSANNSSTKPYSAKPTSHAADEADSTYPLEKIQAEHMKESYSTTDAVPGSMNIFEDAEPGVNKAESKANYLVEQSKRNLANRAANPKEAVDNLRETGSLDKVGSKIDEIKDSVGRSAQETKEGAKRGFNNLQENVKSAADDVSKNIR